jgi:hypothetical protein
MLLQIAELLIRDLEEQPDQGNSSYIVLNSTAEFCRTLGDIPSIDTLGDLYGDEEMVKLQLLYCNLT